MIAAHSQKSVSQSVQVLWPLHLLLGAKKKNKKTRPNHVLKKSCSKKKGVCSANHQPVSKIVKHKNVGQRANMAFWPILDNNVVLGTIWH